MDRSMIDAASGGALVDKTPAVTRHLIFNMASNTQGPSQSRMVNEIGAASNQRLENQLTELTSLVRQLVVGQHQPTMATKVCDICTSVEHPTDMCPTLQETELNQPENVGSNSGQLRLHSNRIGQSIPSVVNQFYPPQSPSTKLKPLPEHLKYAYLDDHQHFPNKKAIGWTLTDLPRINPSICIHKILLVEEAQHIRQQQRRLNPTILDIVKKEVTRLLTAGIIYPISDSK
ncbi:hypothetical protein CR513_56184, partial [Mucuna pruriens]